MTRASGSTARTAIWPELARASESPGSTLEDVCFDAQQAAEKAFKAVLLLRGVDFPWVHDLTELLDLVQQSGTEVPDAIGGAVDLTEYATGGRYPGSDEPVTEEECAAAIQSAEVVVAWAQGVVGQALLR
jgi:HEPN domain-containing protein